VHIQLYPGSPWSAVLSVVPRLALVGGAYSVAPRLALVGGAYSVVPRLALVIILCTSVSANNRYVDNVAQ